MFNFRERFKPQGKLVKNKSQLLGKLAWNFMKYLNLSKTFTNSKFVVQMLTFFQLQLWSGDLKMHATNYSTWPAKE